MTTIGYATLQIIPSLTGVSDAVNKQLGFLPGAGKRAGQQLGSGIAAGMRASESDIKRAADNYAKLYDHVADATGKLRTAEAQLQQLRASGANNARVVTAEERVAKARRDEIRLVNDAKVAYSQLDQMRNNVGNGPSILSRLVSEQKARDIGTKVGRTLGLAIAAAAGAGIAGIGYTLTKGFERLQSIDQATFKLKALGHSGAETKQIMDNALASVKGTSFGLADAATAAASAVAAGIKPGQDLTKYLTEVGDAATVAGISFQDMGSIFNKIQTSNKAYTDDLNQLSDKGLPIFQWLQKEYGVTADALTKMVEKGEVDSAHFQKAINDNIGGAALKMGESFGGAVEKLEASVARLGANFLTAILGGQGGSALEGPTEAVGRLTTKFDEIGAWVQSHAPQIREFFTNMVNDIKPVVEALGKIAGYLASHPGLIEAVVIAFAGWKAITAISEVATGLKGILTTLGLIGGPAATAAGASIGTGLLAGLGSVFTVGAVAAIINQALPQSWKDWSLKNLLPSANSPLGKLLPDSVPAPPPLKPDQMIPPYGTSTGDAANPPPPGERWIRMTSGAIASIPIGQKLPVGASEAHARGGQIHGPGTGTSDSILAWLSTDEFIVNAAAARKNLPLLNVINSGKLPGFADGGLVKGDVELADIIKQRFGITDIGGYRPADKYGEHSTGRALDVMVGNDKAKGDAVKDFALANASAIDLKWAIWQQRLWSPDGTSKPMEDRGSPTQNHMDHVHIFSGTGIVNGLRGALTGGGQGGQSGTLPDWDAIAQKESGGNWSSNTGNGYFGGLQFTQSTWDAFKPAGAPARADLASKEQQIAAAEAVLKAQGKGAWPNTFTTRPGAAAPGPGAIDPASSDQTAATTPAAAAAGPSSGGGASLPASFSGLSSFGLDSLGSGIGTTSSGSDLSVFGKAAGSAVSGQLSSALGVFGIGDSPPWLQAASKLIGGIKVSGKDGTPIFDGSHPLSFGQGSAGRSAAPLAAAPAATGTPPPPDAGAEHHGRAGQQQPPGVVYNIRTATVEDAFLAADRKQKERAAMKLSRF